MKIVRRHVRHKTKQQQRKKKTIPRPIADGVKGLRGVNPMGFDIRAKPSRPHIVVLRAGGRGDGNRSGGGPVYEDHGPHLRKRFKPRTQD